MIEEKIMKKKYFDGFVFLPLHIYRRHPTPPIWKLCLIPNLPLIQSLKCSTFPLEWWANSERSVNERWTNAEWTQSERCLNAEHKLLKDMWTLNESEHERSANASAIWTVNARWTNDERFIRKVSGIFLALYLTLNLVRIYMYELLNLYKRTAWNRNYL